MARVKLVRHRLSSIYLDRFFDATCNGHLESFTVKDPARFCSCTVLNLEALATF